ncbi:hypothetical protein SESBI_15961 [Sesbania bispinosa]|nr:hypothetical protein SESBI_15961 [Sesbania bispinosa]
MVDSEANIATSLSLLMENSKISCVTLVPQRKMRICKNFSTTMGSLALRLAKRSTMRTGGDGGEEGAMATRMVGNGRSEEERAKKPSISRI